MLDEIGVGSLKRKTVTRQEIIEFAETYDKNEDNIFYLHYDNCEIWEDHMHYEGSLFWLTFKEALDHLLGFVDSSHYSVIYEIVDEEVIPFDTDTAIPSYKTIIVTVISDEYEWERTQYTIKKLFSGCGEQWGE